MTDLTEPQMSEWIKPYTDYKKNKVLILSAARKVSLVHAFQDVGWHVTGHDLDKSAVALDFCDAVAQTVNPNDYDLIIPTRDAELIECVGVPNAMCAKKETIEICRNKLLLARELKDAGLKSPQVMFCKPSDGAGSRNATMMYQECLSGDEYSVDLFANFNSEVISVVPRRRLRIAAGESIVSQTVKNDALLQESIVLSNALRLIGHNVLQGFWMNGSMMWTDVNARFGGASIVSIIAGCRSPLWLLKLVNGETVEPQIGKYQVGLTGKSFTEWSFD